LIEVVIKLERVYSCVAVGDKTLYQDELATKPDTQGR